MTNWRILAIPTLLYASLLAAQTAPNWTEQNPQTAPPPLYGHAMAFDSAHGQVVLFGGEGANGLFLSDTWVWDGSIWTQKFPVNSPRARYLHAMAYDSVHGQVVLFGGSYTDNNGIIHFLSDTWLWDGSNWTQEPLLPTVPLARYGHAMAFDSAQGQVVLFGGISEFNSPAAGAVLSDTWVWNGSTWTEESPQTSPPARFLNTLTYDSAHSQVVLFGGSSQGFSSLNDTWLWDGSNWTEESPQTSPSARAGHATAFDSAHGQTVLFGGYDQSSTHLNDTWVWDGSNWTEESPQTSPSMRQGHAMAYDSTHGQAVMFGGSPSAPASLSVPTPVLGDTWIWIGAPLTTPAAGPSISGVVSASAFGAFSAVAPGSWVEIYGSNLAPSTQGWTGADFTGNNAPTMLDGVSVSIAGQAAFVDYISATQVNAQLPSNIATGGALQLTVTNANGTSTAVNVTVNPTEPGLLAPASFKIRGNQYVVAQQSDGTCVLPVGAISGVASSPAKPGETIVIYGVGFGSVTPNIPAGGIATETNQLSASFEVLFGKTQATLPYFGLAPNFVGLYQFNVTVPAVADNDLVPFTFNLSGVPGAQVLFTAVQQ
jgi:uncharacterized protein (TIGR03437 family)